MMSDPRHSRPAYLGYLRDVGPDPEFGPYGRFFGRSYIENE